MLSQQVAIIALSIFFSYAHEDSALRNELEKQLSILRWLGLITEWYDRDIHAGTEWEHEINAHLDTAQLILLLISPDFLASPYCYSIEMMRALERHFAGEARVIPIILRPVEWEGAPFSKLQMLPTDAQPVTSWSDRDAALLNVTKGIRKAVENLNIQRVQPQASSPSTVNTPATMTASSSTPWNVLLQRNPFFTGREAILRDLHMTFTSKGTISTVQPQAISGLGGIGKTQIAVEYAYRYRDDYRAVLWARAGTPEELTTDFVAIAQLLDLAEKGAQDQSLVVKAVKRWLETNSAWLLILDNVDTLAMVRDYLPVGNSGHILLTTRAQSMSGLARKVEIDKMEPEAGALFLLRRAGIIVQDAPLDNVSESDQATARAIVQAMDGLPLALDQAGAYIEETECGLSNYYMLYRKQRAKLLKLRGGFVPGHPKAVATTWSLAFANVERANPAAVELLRICAFLAPDAIPEEILSEGMPELGPVLQPVAADPFELNIAIGELLKYSLLRRNPKAQTLTIHQLVQVVLRDEMEENTQRLLAERTVKAVNRAFPDVAFEAWPRCERLLPHAQVCAGLIEQWSFAFPEAARLLTQAGNYLTVRAQYLEAEPLLQHSLNIRESMLGAEHIDTAGSLNSLAYLYQNQGKYEQAESLYQRALAIREAALGTDHPDTAETINDLANLFKEQGKYEQAESLYQRALTIREGMLGTDHPDTAETLDNLAILYRRWGKYEQAEPLYQRALTIREKVLGPEHPDTATSLNNLANLYYDQGKYEQAEPLYQRALPIWEEVLGPEHPDTATSLNNLANLYYDQGKYEQAEPLYQRALAIAEKMLGPEHPKTATFLHNLANLYQKQGKYEQAEPSYQHALAIAEKVLGPEHPGTASYLNSLANLYQNQGKYEQAELLYQRALTIREKVLGPEHPDTATSLNNLANLYQNQGKYIQAELLHQRALTIREKVLGPEHPDTAISLNSLANLYSFQGKYEQAEPLYQRALPIAEKVLGPEHPDVALVLENYASLLRKMLRTDMAVELEERAQAICARQTNNA